jgi:hypothetical protein
MILALLRRDPALRPKILASSLLASLGLGQFISLYVRYEAYQQGGPLFDPTAPGALLVVSVIWMVMAGMLFAAQVNVRSTDFDLVLPLPARTIWTARMLAVLGTGLLDLVLTAVIFAFAARVRGIEAFGDRSLVALGLRILVMIPWMVALVQNYAPRLAALRWQADTAPFLLVAALSALAGTYLLGLLPLYCIAIPLILSALLFRRAARAVPPAYLLVPTEPEDGRGPAAVAGQEAWQALTAASAAPPTVPRGIVTRTLARNLYPLNTKMGWSVAFFPIIIAYAILMASREFDLGLIMVVWMWTFFTFLAIAPLSTLHRIDPLPIPRRRLLPLLVLPGLILAALSYGIALEIGAAGQRRDGLITCRMLTDRSTDREYCGLLIPRRYLTIAPGDEIPEIAAPWGERHTPWHAALIAGGRPHVYSRFSTPPGSSAEYIAHQLSRAIERIYGARIPAAELQARYLVARDDGTPAYRESGVPLAADYPGLAAPFSGHGLIPLTIALMGVPWLLLMALIFPPLGRVARESARPWLFPLIAAVPMVIFIGYITAALREALEPWVVNAFVEVIARRITAATPGGAATLWGATLLLLAGSYLLAGRGLRRVEAPIEGAGR